MAANRQLARSRRLTPYSRHSLGKKKKGVSVGQYAREAARTDRCVRRGGGRGKRGLCGAPPVGRRRNDGLRRRVRSDVPRSGGRLGRGVVPGHEADLRGPRRPEAGDDDGRPEAREELEREQERQGLDLQSPAGHEVPRRHAVQRRRRLLQLQPLVQLQRPVPGRERDLLLPDRLPGLQEERELDARGAALPRLQGEEQRRPRSSR